MRAHRPRCRRRPGIEPLEPRQLLTGPSASINSVTISLAMPGSTSVSGALNPGDSINAYRIDGSAGETLSFLDAGSKIGQRKNTKCKMKRL